MLSNSPLFAESKVYRPFSYPWAVDITVEHEKMHWIEAEIPLGDDVTDWKLGRVTTGEKEFITQILRMFTTQDVMVGGYYYDLLIPVFGNNEIRNMLGSFAVREGTHQRGYALVTDTLGFPEGEYAAFLDYAEMKAKAEFATDARADTLRNLGLALGKGVINEGLSLFASFVMLLNFQRFGKMKGMCKVVEWSIKDETKHVEGVARLFRSLCAEHPEIVDDGFKKEIYDLFREAVRLEDAFIDLAYGGHAIEGLSADEVKRYIRYIADRRLTQLGLKPNFQIANNPLPWLDWIVSAADHTNFFEGKVADYEVGGLQGEWAYDEAPKLPRHFTLYTKEGCPWCALAKDLLKARGYTYTQIDLTDNHDRWAFFAEHGFHDREATMPKLWEGEAYIGGYTELERLLNR